MRETNMPFTGCVSIQVRPGQHYLYSKVVTVSGLLELTAARFMPSEL